MYNKFIKASRSILGFENEKTNYNIYRIVIVGLMLIVFVSCVYIERTNQEKALAEHRKKELAIIHSSINQKLLIFEKNKKVQSLNDFIQQVIDMYPDGNIPPLQAAAIKQAYLEMEEITTSMISEYK